MEYAVCELAKIADNPIALEIAQVRMPAQFPNAEKKAAYFRQVWIGGGPLQHLVPGP